MYLVLIVEIDTVVFRVLTHYMLQRALQMLEGGVVVVEEGEGAEVQQVCILQSYSFFFFALVFDVLFVWCIDGIVLGSF